MTYQSPQTRPTPKTTIRGHSLAHIPTGILQRPAVSCSTHPLHFMSQPTCSPRHRLHPITFGCLTIMWSRLGPFLFHTFRPMTATPSNYALCGFFVRRTPRACHGACDHLRPRQAPRQSRGLLGGSNARTRLLRSKRRSGHRKRLDNRRHFSGEFGHARRLLRYSNGFFRILRHASALHSTSLASELQSERSNG